MLTRGTIIAVLEHYDLGALRDCRCIHRGVAGDPWWIETTTGQYFFKRRHSDRSRSQLVEAQQALVRHLRRKGFPAPIIVPTRYGTSFLQYQDEVYEIHHFIPGDLCDVSKLAHLTSAARTLAWYHNVVWGFDHPGLHRPRERYGPKALREILDQLVADWRGQTDAHLDQLIGELEEHSRDLTTRFDGFGELPELVIHADYYAENLIFQGDSVAALVDYDLAQWSFRGMELAEALIYFAVAPAARLKHIVYSDVLDLDAIRRFLAPYTETSRLSESEIYALPHFIRTIWLCASLNPPLQPRLSLESAPHALPEILTLADWARAHVGDLIEIGLATLK
jgi:homoserine kinase type II